MKFSKNGRPSTQLAGAFKPPFRNPGRYASANFSFACLRACIIKNFFTPKLFGDESKKISPDVFVEAELFLPPIFKLDNLVNVVYVSARHIQKFFFVIWKSFLVNVQSALRIIHGAVE